MKEEVGMVGLLLSLLLKSLMSTALQPGTRSMGQTVKKVYQYIDDNDNDIRQLSTLVDVLENLGILDQEHRYCYMLDKIVKTPEKVEEDMWKVSIDLYIRELSQGNDTPDNKPSGGKVDKNASLDCANKKAGLVHIPSLGEQSIGDVDNNDTMEFIISQEAGSEVNGTSKATAPVGAGNNNEDDYGNRKVSKTQMMVIITCSTVIGLFFIAALSMRIRNYIKRLRAEQATSRRPTFRSASVALRGTNHSDDRKDLPPAKVVKPSGSSLPIIDSKDTQGGEYKPLLVISSSAGNSPSSMTPPTKQYGQKKNEENSTAVDGNLSNNHQMEFQDQQNPVRGHTKVTRQSLSLISRGSIPPEIQEEDSQGTETELDDHGPPQIVETNIDLDMNLRHCDKSALQGQGQGCAANGNLNTTVSTSNQHQLDAPSPITQESSLYSLASTGFTQSDGSLSSLGANPPYSYGNQSEYIVLPYDDSEMEVINITPSPRPSPLPSPRPSPRQPRKIFLNRLDTIDTLDPFYVHGSLNRLKAEAEARLQTENNQGDNDPPRSPRSNRPPLVRTTTRPLDSVSEVEVDEKCEPNDLNKDHMVAIEDKNEESILTTDKERLASTDSKNSQGQRKSVTFSADLEDVEANGEDSGSLANESLNDVFTDENTCLLGPEFEGVEPTYV